MREIWIKHFGPELHAPGRNLVDIFAARQSSAPDIPKGSRPRCLLSVLLDSLASLLRDSPVPKIPRTFVRKDMAGVCSRPQHVKIMDFAEKVLQMFQVVRPSFVFGGKEILDDVAEPLDPDSKGMQGYCGPATHGTVMQLPRISPPLQRQMLENWAARPDPGRA